ncbi:MAG: hypothetical protein FWG52_02120, partial [Proteobacteria bacterium]|nr:hypothetical protein [Pseudomonadota bacterium]
EILSPTSRMMKDFGVSRSYGEARARTAWQRMTGQPATVDGAYTARVIPNDNLMYRDTRLINNVNVQDANLLKIRVTYLYETKMPLTRYFFMPFMNANLTGVLFAGQARRFGGVAVGSDWRVPLVSYQTVRMQSDFKEASLSAAAPGSDGGTGNDWDGDGGHDDSNPLGLPQYEEEPGGEISPPDSGYITVSLGHGATNKNLGPVTIVTEEDRGVVTRKTVKIVDGKIIIDGVQATGYDGAVAVPAHIDQRLGGNSAKYGPNPLDDPYVLALVAYSPALQENLKTLIEGNGWNVRYTNGNSYVDYANKIIYIRKGPNEVGVLKALSHEVGHALRRPAVSRLADFPVATQNAALAARNAYLRAVPGSAAEEEAMGDYLKAIRDAAVQKYLESEGDAVLKNIQVQQEILSNGGPNIGVDCGFSGSCQDRYRTIYEQYLVDNNADAARTAIAELRKDEEAAGTTETYKENFGRQWNESHKLVWETDLRQQKYP